MFRAPHRGDPGDQLNGNTEESCTQYNILKVARHLFTWTANASYADFAERAVLNGILGNQVSRARPSVELNAAEGS